MTHNYSSAKTPKITVSIVGARGYSGQELARLLLHHPSVTLTHCFATSGFDLFTQIFDEKAKTVTCLPDTEIFNHLTDVVFLATPAEVSMELAPQILAAGKTVIDISGAFRLKTSDMKKWYGFAQTSTSSLATADYGLAPFCGPLSKDTRLIANPGCYATSVSLALIPLIQRGLIDVNTLVIDAKSGTTGAGRKASEAQLFAEVSGDCLPYKVGKHQHLPEIQEAVAKYTGQEIQPHFATHLLPVKRGIISSIYATATTTDLSEIENAYREAYQHYPLVRTSRDVSQFAKLSHVVGTPFTHISFELVGNKLYVFSVIDNLLKGAASQAVENLNRHLDLPLTYSLLGE